MREKIYHLLVNRVPGIRERFLKKRQEARGGSRMLSLLYLLWLNLCYYVLGQKRLGQSLRFPFYEEKKLWWETPESCRYLREAPEVLARRLSQYEVISFDVFDTLIFRPFSCPADVFYLVGEALSCPGFKDIRIRAEEAAREKKVKLLGTREVTFEEIWQQAEKISGISKKRGMEAEWEAERRCCFANPYLYQVVWRLWEMGKRPLVLSDMYLGRERIEELLKACGYPELKPCFVSCDYGQSKSEGGLFEAAKAYTGMGKSWIHVGDNRISDGKRAAEKGIEPFWYPNVNEAGNPYRTFDMSAVTGSLYRGMVNAWLYSGQKTYSREYEYGFVYGGLFALGYCRFIHACAKRRGIRRLLFLARDGAVLYRLYARLYPREQENIAYVYWSRLAALKVGARQFRQEYFQRFLFHKVNQGFSIREIFGSMELEGLLEEACGRAKLRPEEELTNRNAENVRKYLTDVWEKVLDCYEEQTKAAEQYFRPILKGWEKAAAIDVGWAGSGALMLDWAVNDLWKMHCPITGILAGTTAAVSQQPDMTEPYETGGRLASYLFSPGQNRDLWKFHDSAKGHNLYWELFTSAPEGSLKGFYQDECGNCGLQFKKNHLDVEKISEIQRGILDFAEEFQRMEKRLGYEIPISGRDAYAPMLNVLGRKNRDFREGLKDLLDEVHVG